jgi:hypothetical protein
MEKEKATACVVCGEPIADNAKHYRFGDFWIHVKCYAKPRPKP